MQNLRVPRFKRVLCCLHLRRGCILLACVNLVIACLAVLAFAALDYTKTFMRIFLGSEYEMQHRAYRSKVSIYILLPLFGLYTLAELSMTVVALVALIKKKLNLIKVVLYFHSLVTVFMMLYRMFDVNQYLLRWELMFDSTYLVFKCYFLLSLRSQVKKMMDREKEEPELEMGTPIPIE